MNPSLGDNGHKEEPNRAQADWIVAYENHLARGGPAPAGIFQNLSVGDQQRLTDTRRALDALHQAFGRDDALSQQSTGEPPGQLGDFRILREIGRGGMGVVYEAEQISMGRKIALKILPLAAMLDEKRLERFNNEVRAAATLDHPHCVPIYSAGEERGVHFYAMKLIRGQSLADAVTHLLRLDDDTRTDRQTTGTQTESAAGDEDAQFDGDAQLDSLSLSRSSGKQEYFRQVAALGVQAADALHHAHERGIVHRDMKPSNLLLDPRGNLWITDFGLARIEADAGITMTGDLPGTLRYMSPEQALGKRALVDHRVDIYSLGVTLYELVALRPAIRGNGRAQILRDFAEKEPLALRKIDPSIPVELETIVGKAIEKNPSDRYATAAELADDLQRYLSHKPILAKRSTRTARTAKWVRRHPMFAALIAVTFFAAVSVVGLSLRHAHELSRVNDDLSDSLAESERLRGAAVDQQAEMRRAKYIVDMRLANRSMTDGFFNSARERLQQYLPPSPFAEDRDFPWYFLWQKCLEATNTFRGHTGLVRSSTIAPNSGIVISGGDDSTVRLFDLSTQEQVAVLADFVGKVYAVAITPDEQTLLTAGEAGELLAWNLAEVADGSKPTPIGRLEGHANDVLCLAVSPDGSHLASAGAGGRVLVWELPTLTQVASLEGHSDWVRGLDFSPNGETLASISHDDYLILWDLHEATEKHRIKIVDEVHPLGLSVCFHPSGQFVATGSSRGEVRVVRLSDYEMVSVLDAQIGWVRSLSFSGDGQLLAASGNDPFIRLLHVNSQMQLTPWRTFPGHQRETWCVRFCNDDRTLFSTGIDGTTVVRNVGGPETAGKKNDLFETVQKKLLHEVRHRRLSTSRERDKLFLAGRLGGRLFEVNDLQDPLDLRTQSNGVCVEGTMSADGRWMGLLQWTNISFKKPGPAHSTHSIRLGPHDRAKSAFDTLAFHPSKDVMAAGAHNGELLIVKIPSKEYIARYSPFGEATIADALFTSDGRFIAACFCDLFESEPAAVVIWDVHSGAEVGRVENVVRLLAMSPFDCQLALVNRNQSIQLWDVDRQSTAITFQGHTSQVVSGDFSPDGKYLATTALSGPIKIWSIDTGQLVLDIDHDLQLPQIVFGPEHSLYASDIEIVSHEPKLDYQFHLVPLLEGHLAD